MRLSCSYRGRPNPNLLPENSRIDQTINDIGLLDANVKKSPLMTSYEKGFLLERYFQRSGGQICENEARRIYFGARESLRDVFLAAAAFIFVSEPTVNY